ncbi:tetratricopeptide repeat protein [Streptomyces mauvecolor]|uniref:Tetratricopeptide repeat protein n=1 Tax=Streptomyces mauvecolor TaxID=58345 RepID=A0ABV9UY27_9ACTN
MNAHASNGSMAINNVEPGGQVSASFFAPPRRPVTWPHTVGVLPRQADHFLDRRPAEQMQQAMADGGTAVLAGMGGVGKTQLAAHHARALLRAGALDLLVWMTASDPTAIMSGYAEAEAAAAILGTDKPEPEEAARAFLNWLEPSPTRRVRWLVVLDDVADPADLRGLWPPRSPHGRTLITTRRRDQLLQGDSRRLVPVGVFNEQEAAAYLTATLAAHDRHESADQLALLAADLGHLPLALSQAAAYLIDTALDCTTYHRLLTDRAHTLTEVLPDPSKLPDDQATTLAAAWSLSIDRADQLPPAGLARPMLQLAAMLNPNGIPASVLSGAPALQYLAERATRPAVSADIGQAETRRWWPRHRSRPPHATPAPVTAEDARGVLRTLDRLSLIDYTPATEHQAVRIHQLIQRAVRDTLTTAEHAHRVRAAADAVATVWPENEQDIPLSQSFRANAEALGCQAEDALYQSGAHEVLFRAGRSLGNTGQYSAAVIYFRQLADTANQRLGADHYDTLRARGDLAGWMREAGDAAGAARALTELLPDMTLTLGPDHPHTLLVRKMLIELGASRDPEGAAEALHALLTDMVRALGPGHPYTFGTLGHLIALGESAEDTVEPLSQHLAYAVGVLGPDHTYTLAIRGDIAESQGRAGDAEGAVTGFAELLPDMVRVLGPDHPHTFAIRDDLAGWRGRAGDGEGAIAAFAELVADMVRVLGPDHPHTLGTQANLNRWRAAAGHTVVDESTD